MAGNTMNKGSQTEAKFLAVCFERNWQVAIPFHHCQGYDYVFRFPGNFKWFTVQVKTPYLDKGKLIVSLRRSNEKGNRPYETGDFDYLFASHQNKNWLIPWAELFDKKSCIVLGGGKYFDYEI